MPRERLVLQGVVIKFWFVVNGDDLPEGAQYLDEEGDLASTMRAEDIIDTARRQFHDLVGKVIVMVVEHVVGTQVDGPLRGVLA